MSNNLKSLRLPESLRKKIANKHSENVALLKKRLREFNLYTVCESARCPNLGECFKAGTATFLIMGDVCTRNCRFCNIGNGMPETPDIDEPERVALAAAGMALNHVVVTSVTRDDLPDGGADHFARTIREISSTVFIY